jgi:hypothetical protein
MSKLYILLLVLVLEHADGVYAEKVEVEDVGGIEVCGWKCR